ncbi:alpha/beta fold hydrolase [Saccharopolyspora sp. NPDC002578]
MLLHGAADEEVPLEQFADYAAVHDDLETVVLPGTGHYALIEPENPAAHDVARTLRDLTSAWTPTGRTTGEDTAWRTTITARTDAGADSPAATGHPGEGTAPDEVTPA